MLTGAAGPPAMRATSLAVLLGLLALCQLAAPIDARQLLGSGKKASASEAELLRQQEEQLAQLVASGQAEIAQQAEAEARKAAKAAADQKSREAEQLAAQQEELAALAKKEGAAENEQEALDRQARRARREAEKAARRAKKELQDAEDQNKSSGDSDSKKSKKRKGRKSARDAEAQASADGGSSAAGGGSSARNVDAGPIWGLDVGRGGGGPIARATYHYYAPGYETSSLYCADAFAPYLPAKPDTFLLQYPWTAYCNDDGLGPMSQDKCGRCLKVTNTATGRSVKTRVVDLCGTGGIDMDPLGFNAIDDGAGVRDGHMNVRLEWC